MIPHTVAGASVRLLDDSRDSPRTDRVVDRRDFRFFCRPAPGPSGRCPGSARGCHRRPDRGENPRDRYQGRLRPTGTLRISAWSSFFELLLVVAVVVITWFALYAVHRLITDDS